MSTSTDQRPRDPGSPAIAIACWVIIAAVLIDFAGPRFLLRPWFGTARTAAAASSPEFSPPSSLFTIAAQTTLHELRSAKPDERSALADAAIPRLRALVTNPSDHVGLAILAGEAGPELARDVLDRASKVIPEPSPAREDIDALRAPLTAETRERLIDRYGWFGRLAASHGLGDDEPERASVLAAARRTFLISAGFIAGLLVVGVASVGLFVSGLVLLSKRKLRGAYAPPAGGGSVYLEAFAIFLVGLIAVQQVGEAIRPVAPAVADLSRWALLACVLWPRLRGVDRDRWSFATGWHVGLGVFRESAAGIVGYLACLPIVALGLGLTLVAVTIERAFAPGTPPPSHPLGDMIAHSPSLWTKVMIVMLAVAWAPLVEESIFRGALQHHLRGRLAAAPAWILVGVVFAALHPQGLVAIPALATIGATFSMLREWRGSLIAPMVAHAINNGVITGLLFALTA